jgi:hypothetical protein
MALSPRLCARFFSSFAADLPYNRFLLPILGWTHGLAAETGPLRRIIMAQNGIKTVDPKEIERLLMANTYQELTEELFSFGQLLLDEVQQRTAQLDTKLISLLGWTAAILAFLLVGDASWLESTYKLGLATTITILLATLSSLGAVACSFLGVKTEVFQFSSEKDWFKTSLFDDVLTMKKYHLVSMLETHQAHNRLNERKGQRAHEAEWLLAVSAVLVGLATLAKLYPHLCALLS